MAVVSVTEVGISRAISSLNYKQNSIKARVLQAIRNVYAQSESIDHIKFIETDQLIKEIWNTSDDPVQIRAKRRNFYSLRSAIIGDLEKLSPDSENPDRITISPNNTFDISEAAKNEMLNSFSEIAQKGNIDLNQIADVLSTISNFLSKIDPDETANNQSLENKLDQIQKQIQMISDATVSNGMHSAVSEKEEDVEGIEQDLIEQVDDLEEMDEDDIEEIEDDDIIEVDEDTEIEEVEDDDFDLNEEDLDDIEDDIEAVDEDDIIEVDEDTEIEEVEDDDFDLSEEDLDDIEDDIEAVDEDDIIEVDEDTEIEEVEDDDFDVSEEDLDNIEDDIEAVDEDDIIEVDEDTEIEEVEDDDFDVSEEDLNDIEDDIEAVDEDDIIEVDEDTEIEEVEDDDVDISEEDLDNILDDIEAVDEDDIIEVDEDTEIEEVEDDNFDVSEEDLDDIQDDIETVDEDDIIEVDEDTEIEEVEDDDFDVSEEDLDNIQDDIETVDEDDIIEVDEDTEIEEVEDDDFDISEEDLDNILDDIEAVDEDDIIELDEDTEIEEVEDDDFDVSEEDLDDIEDDIEAVDEDDIIEVDEDTEIEEVEVDDFDLSEEDLDDIEDDIEAVDEDDIIEVDEDTEIEEVEDDDFDLNEEDLDDIEDDIEAVDEDDIIELDEDTEIEDVDENEFEAFREFQKEREQANHFDEQLADSDKKYNQYATVPPGNYTIGSTQNIKNRLPLQEIALEKFYIGKYPVTNSLFEAFIQDTGYITTAEKRGFGVVFFGRFKKEKTQTVWRRGSGNDSVKKACWYQPTGPGSSLHQKKHHPVVQVSVEDATAFASWIGRRLPTETEWEAMARTDQGLKYPWGDQWADNVCNTEQIAIGDTTPVDKYEKYCNPLNIADLLGNTMEWTSDTIPNPYSKGKNDLFHVAKSCAWNSSEHVTIGSRSLFKIGYTSNIIGFRCISEFLV